MEGLLPTAAKHCALLKNNLKSNLTCSFLILGCQLFLASIAWACGGFSTSGGLYTDRIILSWQSNTFGVALYKSENTFSACGGPDVTLLADLPPGSPPTITDTNVAPGSKYYYRLLCKDFSPDCSSLLSASTSLSNPQLVDATDGTFNDKIRLTWQSVPGAVTYKIYASTSSNGVGPLVGQVSGITFDHFAPTGELYYYVVKAISADDIESAYSSKVTGYRNSYYIKGYVLTPQGALIDGASVNVSYRSFNVFSNYPCNNGSGSYLCPRVPHGATDVQVTPSFGLLEFTPPIRSYSIITDSQSNQNFVVSTTFSISGSVSPTQAEVRFNGTVCTNNSGNFSCAGIPYDSSGVLTPYLTGYLFTPPQRTYENITLNRSGQSFTGILSPITTATPQSSSTPTRTPTATPTHTATAASTLTPVATGTATPTMAPTARNLTPTPTIRQASSSSSSSASSSILSSSAGSSGNSNTETPVCGNGIDDDGDGFVDYPNDSGCDSSMDQSESNLSGPQCDNGLDDDGDGLIDLNDSDCASSQDLFELSDSDTCSVRGVAASLLRIRQQSSEFEKLIRQIYQVAGKQIGSKQRRALLKKKHRTLIYLTEQFSTMSTLTENFPPVINQCAGKTSVCDDLGYVIFDLNRVASNFNTTGSNALTFVLRNVRNRAARNRLVKLRFRLDEVFTQMAASIGSLCGG